MPVSEVVGNGLGALGEGQAMWPAGDMLHWAVKGEAAAEAQTNAFLVYHLIISGGEWRNAESGTQKAEVNGVNLAVE